MYIFIDFSISPSSSSVTLLKFWFVSYFNPSCVGFVYTLFRKLPIFEYVVKHNIHEYVVMYYVSLSINYAVLWDRLRVMTSLHLQCARGDVSSSWWHAEVSLRVSSVQHSNPAFFWEICFEQRHIQLCPVQPLLSDHKILSKASDCNEWEKWSVYWHKQLHTSERKKTHLNLKVLGYLELKCLLFTCSLMSMVFKISP